MHYASRNACGYGAYMLAINESIQEQMQFPFVEKRKFELGNGHVVEYDVVASVELWFKPKPIGF